MTAAIRSSAPARKVAPLVLALLLALTVVPPQSRAASANAEDGVQRFYSALLATMQNGPALGEGGRYAKLAPVIEATFNIPYMTRVSVGPAWASLTEMQRQQVTRAFDRYVTATYADRFDSYSGEKLEVTGTQPSPYGTIVHTRIVKSNGEPVSIDYLMRQNGDAWQVTDVYLTGTISELATRRSEFSSVLGREGVTGLIAMLNHKADILVASATRP